MTGVDMSYTLSKSLYAKAETAVMPHRVFDDGYLNDSNRMVGSYETEVSPVSTLTHLTPDH